MRIWIVDAFAQRAFSGATAAVAPLNSWIDDEAMRAIAGQLAASETAFFTPTGLRGNYELRTFTARGDTPIGGHAALAAGAVLLSEIESGLELAVFDTAAGPLVVRRASEGFAIDLPRRPRTPWTPPQALLDAALGDAEVEDAFAGEYATVVLEDEEALRRLTPDLSAIARLAPGPRAGCLTVTAPTAGRGGLDFVCRFFAPGAAGAGFGFGAGEDAVTASAFTDLVPYWCDRLDRAHVTGAQASRRGGLVRGRRTLSSARLSGPAHIFLRGTLDAPGIETTAPAALSAPEARLAAAENDDLVVRIWDEGREPAPSLTVFEPPR